MRHRKGAGEELKDRYGDLPDPSQRKRLMVLGVCVTGLFIGICLRLAQLHLNPRLELSEEERHHIGEVVLKEPRGNIVDRSGLVLATDKQVPSVWADPRYVEDRDLLARSIGPLLELDHAEMLKKLEPRDETGRVRKFVWLKRWVASHTEDELKGIVEQWPGLHVQREPVRFYPQQETAAHVLGFVNRAGEASEGVELAFNEHLESLPGVIQARIDNSRNMLPSRTLKYEKPTGGADVYLTLDAAIQHSLEDALDRRIVETNASRGMGMVMDPHTGAVLALSTRPAFDPNKYDEYPPELRKNSALIDVFEPGSVFKIVIASAALQHGLVTTETMIDCEGGSFNPYGHRIRDYHKMGVEPFSECFAQSSNIAMIKVAAMLGAERFDQWIRSYGFGQKTSQHFALESRGMYSNREKWSRLTMGSLPMGQEVAVTMPQLARAFAVVANGGELVEPYLVEKAVDKEGNVVFEQRHAEKVRILNKETAATMQELCYLVTQHGTGKKASIDEYRVGGKTGTAQMARKDGGKGYDPDRFTTVFAGFAPVADPKLVAVIVIQEPMIDLHYGGYVCGPVFKEVVRDALIRMQVPEDPVIDEETGRPVTELAREKEQMELEKQLEKERKQREKEEEQEKKEQEEQEEEERMLLAEADADTVDPRISMEQLEADVEELLEPLDGLELVATGRDPSIAGELPDFSGLSKRQVQAELKRLGIPWDPQGAGWVVEQDPPAGTALAEVTVCSLKFGSRLADTEDDAKRTS